MTELLYQHDSYLQTFEAHVTGLDEANRGVQLDRTAFYPGGGGRRYVKSCVKSPVGWQPEQALRFF